MSAPETKPPTYPEVIARLLRPLNGPISIDILVDQILAARPSQARKPRQAALEQIRQAEGDLLVRPDPKTILSLRLAFQGARFRLRLQRETVNTGLLEIENTLQSYLPRRFPLERIEFVDNDDHLVSFGFKAVNQRVETFFGVSNLTQLHVNLSYWFRSQKMSPKDHILFTILDWESGIFRMERESSSAHRPTQLKERNRQFAEIIWNQLEQSSDEVLYLRKAVPTAYALLPDKGGCPPDHWLFVIEEDGRMESDGWDVHYRDGRLSMLEVMKREASGERVSAEPQLFTPKQGQMVYRLKAELAYNPKIWRVIEIQGKQNLADLDSTLREAFSHDFFDHLGGFWKLVRRGGRKKERYREIDLGTVYPLNQGGEGAEMAIAAIGLQIGDKIKYVYDFGDWIDHILTLESIEEPLPMVKYPHEVVRNQPQYVNCANCQKKGKETVAKWVCLTCSNKAGLEVVLCKNCADQHADDHELDEILY